MIANLMPPKMYINGFPKAGLHLAERMAYGLFSAPENQSKWLGTNAWTVEMHDLEDVGGRLGSLIPGQFLKGHMGHLKSVEGIMIVLGIGCVLVYRDLRDVAVSQMYHVLSRTDKFLNHKGKREYKRIKRKKGKEGVLIAIIEGIDEFPGLIDRWETFAPWLDSEWAMCVSFEDIRKDHYKAANQFFDYSLKIQGLVAEEELYVDPKIKFQFVHRIVHEMSFRKTATFRKGVAGEWRKEFTPKVTECFKAHDNGWLQRLGYEKDEKWQ